jgi:sulfotransferase 6B1
MNTIAQKEAFRNLSIKAYRAGARGVVFYPAPRVFVTSVPKAGSHLLITLLRRLPRMMFSGVHHAPRDFRTLPASGNGSDVRPEVDWDRVRRVLEGIRNGQFVTAHFPYRPRLGTMLEDLDYQTILMQRDPRDVVVSHFHYVMRSDRHYLHIRYTDVLDGWDARLMASIRGLPADGHGRGVISIGQRLAGYSGWLQQPNTYLSRFEILIGPNGGGTIAEQRTEIMAIAAHVGRPLEAHAADELAAKIWSPKSATFRKGSIGDWRNHFSPAHIAAFKEVAGQHLIDLGYERDLDW